MSKIGRLTSPRTNSVSGKKGGKLCPHHLFPPRQN